MAALGVLDGALTVAVAIGVFFHAWMSYTARAEIHGLQLTIAEFSPALKAAVELGDPAELVAEVRDDITEAIQSVLGAMRVPTAADHLLGTVSAIVQARYLGPMMKAQADAAALLDGGELVQNDAD